jgi:hypothetical protein
MNALIYTLWSALLLSCFLDLRLKDTARHLSLALVRIVLVLPLFAVVYFYISLNHRVQPVAPLFFSEIAFSLLWSFSACKLGENISPDTTKPAASYLLVGFGGIVLFGLCCHWLSRPPEAIISQEAILIPRYGQLYFLSLAMLSSTFFMAWRTEMFWRAITSKYEEDWWYKYVVMGIYLVCGSLFWLASYRLLYLRLNHNQHELAAALLMMAWLFIVYAVIRHRLLNRHLFISRRIVYSTVARSFLPDISSCWGWLHC